MPLAFQNLQNPPTCLLRQWSIKDLDKLVDVLAWLYVRKPTHAASIIEKLVPGSASFPGREFDAARRLLAVETADLVLGLQSTDLTARKKAQDNLDVRIEKRDGLLFQHISWIAAYINYPKHLISSPHVRLADKGFDGVIVKLNDAPAVGSVVLCEDKATTNPRPLVTGSIWNEFRSIHRGDKDLEIHDAVTALLEKAPHADVERALEGIAWDRIRHYRIALTAPGAKKKKNGYGHIFKDFDAVAIGDLSTRIGEYLALPDVRAFLDDLAKRVIAALDKLEASTRV